MPRDLQVPGTSSLPEGKIKMSYPTLTLPEQFTITENVQLPW